MCNPRFSPSSLLLGISLIFTGFLTYSCDPPSQHAKGEVSTEEVVSQENPDTTSTEQADSQSLPQTSRGLDMTAARITNFSLKDYFPNLYVLVESDANMLQELEAYAKEVITREGLEEEEDLIALFDRRENEIIPHLVPFFENMDTEEFDKQFQNLEGELNQLGLTIQTAEGMFIGLGTSPVLESDIERLASEEYELYLAFRNADAQAQQGEYPYADMKPYSEMIWLGEQLKELSPNPYWEKIEERFTQVLLAFTDVHLVRQPNAREDERGTPLVGGLSLDFYPFMTETQTLSDYSKEQPQSSYSEVMRLLTENMSEISNDPENVYVIVTEWADDAEMAQSRVVSHLSAGEDIPHYLKIRRGDGTDKYAITYRFYEDGDKADAAFEKIVDKYPDARLVFCSVRNNELYQIGPSAD